MRFVGIDLTSAFAASPRAVDVAILDAGLECSFRTARWPAAALVAVRDSNALRKMIADAVPGLTNSDVLAVDGPQALAAAGQNVRTCERILATPGRTPDALPATTSTQPFHGYIRSSIDLFAVLAATRVLVGLDAEATLASATLFEVFPGAEWVPLAGCAIPRKSSVQGRSARRRIFELLGIKGLPALPTADQNDALVGAYLAWCTRHRSDHVTLEGTAPTRAGADLTEGFILHGTRIVPGFELAVDERGSADPVARDELVESGGMEDWADGNARTIRFNDLGLVHGTDPENAWLVSGHDYELETLPPHSKVSITLTHSSTFAGGKGWKVSPKIRPLLDELGLAPQGPLTQQTAISLRVMVKSSNVL